MRCRPSRQFRSQVRVSEHDERDQVIYVPEAARVTIFKRRRLLHHSSAVGSVAKIAKFALALANEGSCGGVDDAPGVRGCSPELLRAEGGSLARDVWDAELV